MVMSMRLFSLSVWLLMVTSAIAQPSNYSYVVDTKGKRLETNKEYYIKPAITDNGGRFTLISRNGSCPFYVGLENTDLGKGIPVKFTPFTNDKQGVRVGGDLKVTFSGASTCVQSTEWRLGQNETTSGRRVIITGAVPTVPIVSRRGYGNYFKIVETGTKGIYNIRWCPTEVCPTCRFICGTAGIFRENGKILLALDGSALPVVFQKE